MLLVCCTFQAKKVKAHNLLKQIVSESYTGFKAKPNAYTQLLGHQQFYAAMFLNQLFNCQLFLNCQGFRWVHGNKFLDLSLTRGYLKGSFQTSMTSFHKAQPLSDPIRLCTGRASGYLRYGLFIVI